MTPFKRAAYGEYKLSKVLLTSLCKAYFSSRLGRFGENLTSTDQMTQYPTCLMLCNMQKMADIKSAWESN